MGEGARTNFVDKTGRRIHVGDIVQHRLGKFGKSSGPQSFKVIQFGKNYHFVPESRADVTYGGILLKKQLCEHSVVVRSEYVPH